MTKIDGSNYDRALRSQNVILSNETLKNTASLSPQAWELIRMLEEAPDRGGYFGQEITRELIHA